jgi:inner membrane protein
MLLWHLGATVAVVRYAFRDDRMDLRFLMLGAVLPDLVDTPVGALVFPSTMSVRLVSHTLLVASLVMVVVVWRTRRGRPRKRWMPVAIGMLVHLALDAMWASPETLWWPFLGLEFTPSDAATFGGLVSEVLADPVVWLGEVAGAAYLIVLGTRGRLGDPAARRTFLKTGTVDVPIEG